MRAVKLNLGCGEAHKPGYVNVDFFTKADLKHDLRQPLPYPDASVDEIRSIHNIEHFSRAEWELIKRDWARVLKPGGHLVIATPNLANVCEQYLKNPDDSYWRITMYGIQDHDGEFHKNGFDKNWLSRDFPDFRIIECRDNTSELFMEFVK